MALSTGTRGSIAELRVAANLMSLGWSVFKNLSPNGSTDLIAVKGSCHTLRVQCKSSLNGQLRNLRAGRNHLLAIVDNGEIRYRATSRRVARLFPSCGLVRRPKRQSKRH